MDFAGGLTEQGTNRQTGQRLRRDAEGRKRIADCVVATASRYLCDAKRRRTALHTEAGTDERWDRWVHHRADADERIYPGGAQRSNPFNIPLLVCDVHGWDWGMELVRDNRVPDRSAIEMIGDDELGLRVFNDVRSGGDRESPEGGGRRTANLALSH